MVILPTLRQLQFFTALARRQSFSRAAEDCLVSQSTLSSAIKELEGVLRVQLVDRSTRTFALTPAGHEVAEKSAALLADAHDLVAAVQSKPVLSGPFHLGVIPTIAPFLLPALTPTLANAYPDLQLFLREDLTSDLLRQLAGGSLDAAILALPYPMDGMESQRVGMDRFWFAAAPDHPLCKEEMVKAEALAQTPLLLLEDGHCLREHALDACQLTEQQVRLGTNAMASSFGATSLYTLAEMTRAGLGATLLPDMAIRQGMARSAGLCVRPLADPAAHREIGIVWRKASGRTADAKALAEAVADALASIRDRQAA